MNSRDALTDLILKSSRMSATEAQQIVSRFREKHLAKGDFFLKSGQLSSEYLFLSDGLIRAYAIDPLGNEITTGFYSAQEMVFEVTSFFNRTLSRENFEAVTDSTGLCLTFNELNTLFHEMPAFREMGRAMLVRGFSTLKARMLLTITESAEQRYLDLIANRPDVIRHAPLKTIATYLGVTDTSLSRIRRDLANSR